jgi:hypothetical protein
MLRSSILAVLFLATFGSRPADALEIREKRWGFDGRVRAGRFNVLSILVSNPGAHNFEGQFVLEDRHGLEKSVGAPTVQPVFVSAGTQRWVQFYVFVNQAGGEWNLRWGKGPRDREKFDGAQFAAPARVLLVDPDSPFAAPGGLRAFPEDLFPTTIAALDALEAVALDHAPRWEAARREAFLDWLRAGGIVHLLHGADGQFPQFPDTLAVLNVSTERTRMGAGLIVRHDATRTEMNEMFLGSHGFPAPELKTDASPHIYNLESQLLQKLAALTKPAIAWWLIYLLTAGYIVVVGPMHYRWSKRLPYLRSIALLVAIVVAFGSAFAFAGRRGANEKQQVNAVAIAHNLGNGRHDVTQWISAFAKRGDLYKLTHAAPANLYSTATEFDSVNGVIVYGREGNFDVDIPLFSTRPFIHRGVLQGERVEVSVSDWQTDAGGNLSGLAVIPPEGLAKTVTHAWVRHGDWFYKMKPDGTRWILDPASRQAAAEFVSEKYVGELNLYSSRPMFLFGPDDEDDKGDTAWLDRAGPLLIARALGTVEALANVVKSPPPPPDQVQLFLYAPLPDGFRVQDKRFVKQAGRVLYWQDIFKP